jgi:hypothetical protein
MFATRGARIFKNLIVCPIHPIGTVTEISLFWKNRRRNQESTIKNN